MIARAVTFWLSGLVAHRLDVEAHLHRGVPSFVVVGLADRAVQEARERVRSGIGSAEYEFPSTRLTLNLAPARERKQGSGFDLAIALAVLAVSGQAPGERVARVAAAAELGLDGRLRPVSGALAIAEAAGRLGLDGLLVAPESAAEARLPDAVPVLPAYDLRHAVAILEGRAEPAESRRDRGRAAFAGAGPCGCPRAGRRQACGRDRGGRRSQPADDRPAGVGQDPAGQAPARAAATADGRRGDRDHPHPLGGGAASGRRPDLRAAVPGAAPQRVGCGPGRWCCASPRRGDARASRRAAAGRVAGVHAAGARGAAAPAGGRRGADQPCGGRRSDACPVPGRGRDEPLPVRTPG